MFFAPKILLTSKISKFSTKDHENDLSFYFVHNYVYITFLNGQKKLFKDDSYQINTNGSVFYFHGGNRKLNWNKMQ